MTSIGIPVYALFDADDAFEERAKSKGKSQAKIDEERKSHIAENRVVLKYFGLAEEDFPSAMVGDDVAIFEDHLESSLSNYWNEWSTACKNVEADAGIILEKNQIAYRIATLRAEGTVPEMPLQILEKVEGKQ